MYIFKAAVVGAGFMGAGIAQVITYSGLPVVLKDVDQKMLDKGMEQLRGIYQRLRSLMTNSPMWTLSSRPCPRL